MKRLFAGLTLLLMSFLAALQALDGLRALVPGGGAYRWVPDVLLALIAVGVFVRITELHRRLLFPRRGQRLLACGIVLYAMAAALAAGVLPAALQLADIQQDATWSAAHRMLQSGVLPLLVVAQVLIVFGVFRALTNLVPPAEFAADF